MKTATIHIGDWNMEDRVLTVPHEKAIAILMDTAKTADVRMDALYELAVGEGKVSRDPRASEMDNADAFLSWPAKAGLTPTPIGFIRCEDWDLEHADDLEGLKDL